MSVLFIDGFDNYSGLSDKWNKVYRGVSIAQNIGKRDTNCLQVGSSYYNDNHYLSYSIEDTDSIIIGFAYKKNITKSIGMENIALNKPTAAESLYDPTTLSLYAVDGDRSSQWVSGDLGITYWITVDLESTRNICGFGLECWYGFTYSWEYYGSNNYVDWDLITSESDHAFDGNLVTTISGIDVNYRYVMADITPVGAVGVRVTDLQVYEYVNVDEGPTTSISFVTSGTEQCIVNLGAENITFETSFSGTTISGCMVSGTWNYVEAKINFDDTNGSVDIRVDEGNVLNLSSVSTTVSGANTIDSIRIYSSDGQKSDYMESVYSHIDDLYICNTSGSINNDFLGVCLVDVAFPSASGTNNDYDIRYYYDDKRYEVIDGPSHTHGIPFEETIQLTDGDDDGFFNSVYSFSTSSNNILLEGYTAINGYEGKAFFRFNNINIPKNAIIEEAILKLTPYESAFVNSIYMHGRFELSACPTIRPISQVDLESRALTSDATKATWDGQKLITFNETNSMHNSLQELVDMDNWQEEYNTVTVIIDFGSYTHLGSTAYARVRNYNWVYDQTNPDDYLDQLPILYLKWSVETAYDMSEYVYGSTIGHKDTYYHDTTVSGVTLSGIDNIYAVQHNLVSKYIINEGAVSELGCKPVFLVSGTEYFGDQVDYATTSSGFYLDERTIFEQNPETSSAWSGKDIVDMEAGSTIV